MIARGAIHNPKIFDEYKNISLDDFYSEENDLNFLENNYEEVNANVNINGEKISDNSSSSTTKNYTKITRRKNSEEDLSFSVKLSKALEKKYNYKFIDIVPIVRDYTEIALRTGNNFHNTKYNVLYMMKTHKNYLELFQKIQQTKNYEQLAVLLEMKEIYDIYANANEKMKIYYDNSYYRERFKELNKKDKASSEK
jgi:tRNA-dihydrouridine synthase